MRLSQLLIWTIVICVSGACKDQKEFQFSDKGMLVPDFLQTQPIFISKNKLILALVCQILMVTNKHANI